MMPRSFKYLFAIALLFASTGPAQALGAGGGATGPEDYTEDLAREWTSPMQLMTQQLTVMMEAQIEVVGMMLDAKHQLETQRLLQEKVAEAHKDYQPSEQMCTFGTFTRDLFLTEESNAVTRNTIVQYMQQRETGNGDNMGRSNASDRLSRIIQYRDKFCDPADNAVGMAMLCPVQTDPLMRNRDINYTTTVDRPLSLDVDLSNPDLTQDEESIFALLSNLFSHKQNFSAPIDAMDQHKYQYHYAELRSVMAMRGIARNSMANIISMKSAAPESVSENTGPYLRALLREFGMAEDEILDSLGENPSYFAQMELLTKKIYQSPTFYTNLYDKPANVQRLRAAMKAVKIMQDRDIHAAYLRREMLMSMLLEVKLRNKDENVQKFLEKSIFSTEAYEQED